MGFRFRKSVKAGPFRMTFSKSGVGYSVGGKRFRVTKKAKGGIRTTANIPGTGISYVKDYGSRRKKITSKQIQRTKGPINLPHSSPVSPKPPATKWQKRAGISVIISIFSLFVFCFLVIANDTIDGFEALLGILALLTVPISSILTIVFLIIHGIKKKDISRECLSFSECTQEAAETGYGVTTFPETVEGFDRMEGHEFEYWCADLLRNIGFSDVYVTPGSGDQGVDILANKDGIKYAIQCKRYSSSLGNTPVQEVCAGKDFYHCHIGAVMTNQYFTAGAIELAKSTNILLWDRDWIKNRMSTTNNA